MISEHYGLCEKSSLKMRAPTLLSPKLEDAQGGNPNWSMMGPGEMDRQRPTQ